MAPKSRNVKETSRSNDDQTNPSDSSGRASGAQLDSAEPIEDRAQPTGSSDRASGEVLAEDLLKEIGGASLEDIMKRGLKQASDKPHPATSALTQRRTQADKQLRLKKGGPQKKMGFTVQPLQSLRAMHTSAARSDSATAFLAKKESRLKRTSAR